jgi:hypothetical protein
LYKWWSLWIDSSNVVCLIILFFTDIICIYYLISNCTAQWTGSVCETREFFLTRNKKKWIIRSHNDFLIFKLFVQVLVKIKAGVCVCTIILFVFFYEKLKFAVAPNNCSCQFGYNGTACQYRTLLIFLKK